VTDHYLLDLLVLRSRRGLAVSWTPIGPANNCQFRMILKIILKKKSRERQASSRKQRLTMVTG